MTEREPVKFELEDLLFTWDDEKAERNFQKHRVTFFAAAPVFLDSGAVISFNSVDENTGEERFNITGMAAPGAVFVVFIERVTVDDDNIIRIISARRATRTEVRQYYADGCK